MLTSYYYT